MLYDKRLQELTKSEILILNLIEQSDEYDGSISDTKDCLKISKQTVCRGFKKLVDIGFVTKTEFFEGRIKRCKYTRNGTNSKNVTIQNDYQKLEFGFFMKGAQNNMIWPMMSIKIVL